MDTYIKDSGQRREFQSGAVRDICEGKGRCDLLPLDVVAGFLHDAVLCEIASFMQTYRTVYIRSALDMICQKYYSGNKPDMMLDLSKHFEAGAVKYGERNWEKGLPLHCYIDSAVRHYLKALRGDTDEPHIRACVWNLVCGTWTAHHLPEMDDLPRRK